MFKYLKLLIIGVVTALILGCPQKKREMFIFGEAYYGSYSGWLQVAISSEPLIDEAEVTVNGEPLKKRSVYRNPPYSLVYEDENPTLANGVTYNLKVDCDIGKAEASATMPGGFTIDAPEQIFVNSPLAVSWTRAGNANFYIVSLWYLDIDTTIVTTESTLVFPGWFFPHQGNVSLYVSAINGPMPKPDSQGNVKGDGFGYWIAELEKSASIEIESSKAKHHILPKVDRERREKPIIRILELYAPYNQKAKEILDELKRR